MPLRRTTALAAACLLPWSIPALPSEAAPAAPSSAAAAAADGDWWNRVATYPVFQNVPTGVDPADATVAEISTVTEDGNTVIYTDASGGRIGFLDITNPAAPVGDGTLELEDGDSPTSVATVGDYVLVVIDSSDGDLTAPSGRVDVVSLSDRTVVREIDLGGQPDSIAVSPDGDYAAVAMENQRDEEVTPPGGEEGDLPQLPAGSLQVLDVAAADPTAWTATEVPLVEDDGDPLPSFVDAGLDTPEDPEPEYVDVNDDDQVVLTLQENNGIVVVDLPTAGIETVFSAGEARVSNVDTTDDGRFNPYDSIDEPREPDAVQWVGDGLVATANEGDWKGGTRGWTVFDVAEGEPVWDAGTTFENLAIRHGLFNDGRADNKGAEPEGLAFAEVGGVPTAFVGSERSNFVAVYDMSDPTEPDFRQVLPTTNGPEGLLPIPQRDLLVVSSEEDDAEVQVRATVGVYELGAEEPSWPDIVSKTPAGAGSPIGWGALGALSGAPGEPTRLFAASDAAYSTGRIYTVDVSGAPARITGAIDVRDEDGVRVPVDIEGLAAREGGGFWLAVEGATGPANELVRTDAAGRIQQRVSLPADVSSHVRNWGLEGVAVRGSGDAEQLTVVLQRPLWVDPSVGAGAVQPLEGNVARIGRYDVAAGSWTWYAYPLGRSSAGQAGDWIGLSEVVAVDADTVAVIERDKLAGTAARVKRVYTVNLPAGSAEEVTPVRKRLLVDLLPAMRARKGWTQEKLEGLGVTTGGRVFAVTDNDGLSDATGETQLFDLGERREVFEDALATRTRISIADRTVRTGSPVRISVRVTGGGPLTGPVRIYDRARLVRTLRLDDRGSARVGIVFGRGVHWLRARYVGDTESNPSASDPVRVVVSPPRRR